MSRPRSDRYGRLRTLGPVSGRETMTALESATLDYRLAGPGPHTGAETVLAFTAANIRLIGAFHRREVQISGLRWAPGYEPVALPSKRRSASRWSHTVVDRPLRAPTAKTSPSPRKKALAVMRPRGHSERPCSHSRYAEIRSRTINYMYGQYRGRRR